MAGQELQFGFVTPQQRLSIGAIEDQWRFAEETGWDSAWVFDHVIGVLDGLAEDADAFEAWTLLAALAATTRRIRLGVFVSGITHRLPAMLLKQAVTVDHVSRGRLILGIGAGWNEREHRAYGLPFPPRGERVALVGETLAALRAMEASDRTTRDGPLLRLDDAPFAPKPVRGRLPVLVGTVGPRMMRHLARYGDIWEGGGSPERMAGLGAELDRACAEVGRDPAEIARGIVASDPGFRALASEDAFRHHVAAYAAVGVTWFWFNIPPGAPSSTLTRISERVIPELRAEARAAAGPSAGPGSARRP
jgi:alkanesulfonate monooxygenase SsuD/methylene tetrahydromethanopterin reductase-like flavin-dependent oxidoreductase (luciferase family)